jgi:hypothetical protein
VARARVVPRGLPRRDLSNHDSEREVVMNISRDTMEPGRPEDSLRQSEEPYGQLVGPALDIVIEHASGRFPYANAARARFHNPSRGSSCQTRSASCRSLPSGDGALFTHVWQEMKRTGTGEEEQLW